MTPRPSAAAAGSAAVAAAGPGGDETSLAIRPPRQRRSREAWQRVLDAGTALVEEGGSEAFTIAAVCERAGVAPRFLYARADTKDALFLAVYEHGLAKVRADQDALRDRSRWHDMALDEIVGQVVARVAGIFLAHRAFLRAIVLVSGLHEEINRRGAHYAQELGDEFCAVLLCARAQIDHPDPDTAVRLAFNAVFSSLVVRVAYGPAFASPALDDDTLVEELATMVRRYLAAPAGPRPGT